MEYNDTLSPINGRRGSLLTDFRIGLNGIEKKNADYFYHPITKLLVETKYPNGSAVKQYYSYSDLPNGANKWGKKLFNTHFIDYTQFGRSEYLYETPIATETQVRSMKDGRVETKKQYTLFRKTAFGQNSGIIDPNGWLSEFEYDHNGRLKVSWLPFDFPTCCSPGGILDYNPVFDRNTQITRITDTIDLYTRTLSRCSSPQISTDNGDGATYLGTDIYDKYNSDSTKVIQTRYKYKALMNYIAGKNDAFHNGNGVEKAFLRMGYTGNSADEQSMMKISCPSENFEQLVMIGGNGLDTNISNQTIPNGLRDNLLRVDVSELIKKFSTMKSGEKLQFEIELMNDFSKITLLQNAQDSRSVIEVTSPTITQIDECRYHDFTTMTEYTENYSERSITTLKKIDDPLQQITLDKHRSTVENIERDGRYSASKSFYGYENRNYKNSNYITDDSNLNPLIPDRTDSIMFKYTGFSKLTESIDQDGNSSYNIYNSAGNLTEISTPNPTGSNGSKRIFSLMSSSDKIKDLTGIDIGGTLIVKGITNEIGITTLEVYDLYNHLRLEINNFTDIDQMRQVTQYEYDKLRGNLIKVIKPDWSGTWYTYDEFNRLIKKKDELLGEFKYAYDDMDRLRFTQNPEQITTNNLTYYQYDDLGRATIVGEAKINQNIAISDLNPNIINIAGNRDAYNTINRTIFDGDAPRSILDSFKFSSYFPPADVEKSYEGQYILHHIIPYSTPSMIAEPNNFEHIKTYHSFVRVANYYDDFPQSVGAIWGGLPDKSIWNNLVSQYAWDINDTNTRVVRNLVGRKSVQAYRDNSDEPFHYIVYSYDPRGRVQSMMRYTENIGFDAVHYKYNSSNQITTMITVDPVRRHTTWYSYDNNGRVDSVWTRLSDTVYAGSGNGSIANFDGNALAKPDTAEVRYEYNKKGTISKIKYTKLGIDAYYHYAQNGVIRHISFSDKNNNQLYKQIIYRDKANNITSQDVQNTDLEYTENYIYDHLSRLTQWKNNYASEEIITYAYDIMSNRVSSSTLKDYQLTTEQLIYSSGANRQLQEYITPEFSKEYRYNRMHAVSSTITTSTTLSKTEKFFYNTNGLLKYYDVDVRNIAISPPNPTGVTVDEPGEEYYGRWKYSYSPGGGRELKRQMNHTNGQELETNKGFYTWNYYLLGADGSQMAEYRGVQVHDSVRFYPEYYLANGGMISMIPDSLGTMQYNFYDHLGSMRMRITRNKNSRINEWNNVEYFNYTPFGEIMAKDGDTSKPDKIGFIGKELDQENSYFLLGARQYDPKIGRFLSVDPLWESFPNYNPYHYCYNNPVSFKDPTGLAPEGEKEDELLGEKQKEDELQVPSNPIEEFVGFELPMMISRFELTRENYFPCASTLTLILITYTDGSHGGFYCDLSEARSMSLFALRGGGHGGDYTKTESTSTNKKDADSSPREGTDNGSSNGLNTSGDLAQNGAGGGDSNTPVPPSSQEYNQVDQKTETSCWRACFESILQKDDRLTPEATALLQQYQDANPDGLGEAQIVTLANKLGYTVRQFGENKCAVLSSDVDSKMNYIQKSLNIGKHVIISVPFRIGGQIMKTFRHAMIVTGMIYDGANFSNFTFMDPYRNKLSSPFNWTPLWPNQGRGENSGRMGIPAIPSSTNISNIGGANGSIFYILRRMQ